MKKKTIPLKLETLRDQDWRGIIALVVLIGGFIVLGVSIILEKELEGVVGVIMALVVQWYFKAKEDEGKCAASKSKENSQTSK